MFTLRCCSENIPNNIIGNKDIDLRFLRLEDYIDYLLALFALSSQIDVSDSPCVIVNITLAVCEVNRKSPIISIYIYRPVELD